MGWTLERNHSADDNINTTEVGFTDKDEEQDGFTYHEHFGPYARNQLFPKYEICEGI